MEDAREIGTRQSGVSRTPDALIGATIDRRYRIESLLGEGGMGLVYRATHIQLDKPLAIKVLRSENIRDEEVLARFQREAQSASNIGNEHIVDIHDFGTLPDGSTYFVMECLEGDDLIEAMDKTRRFPEARAIHIARQICIALGAAHDAGIVHRDLKPENVFLTRRGEDRDFVKVLDFGIAKVANRPHRLTRDGEVLGTPHYMSPEQCSGEAVDHRTDIYALGVLLYEMVTGNVPHDADTMMAILTKQMYEEPVAPRIHVPGVSDGLERIILRALEKKPEDRYPSMQSMGTDLAGLAGEPRPAGRDTLTLSPAPPPTRSKRRLWFIAGAVGAVALAALVIGAMMMRDTTTTSAATPAHAEGTPTIAPDLGETQPSIEQASSEIATTPEPTEPAVAPAAKKKERRPRKPRLRTPPPPAPDPGNGPILDPWK